MRGHLPHHGGMTLLIASRLEEASEELQRLRVIRNRAFTGLKPTQSRGCVALVEKTPRDLSHELHVDHAGRGRTFGDSQEGLTRGWLVPQLLQERFVDDAGLLASVLARQELRELQSIEHVLGNQGENLFAGVRCSLNQAPCLLLGREGTQHGRGVTHQAERHVTTSQLLPDSEIAWIQIARGFIGPNSFQVELLLSISLSHRQVRLLGFSGPATPDASFGQLARELEVLGRVPQCLAIEVRGLGVGPPSQLAFGPAHQIVTERVRSVCHFVQCANESLGMPEESMLSDRSEKTQSQSRQAHSTIPSSTPNRAAV